MKRKRFTEEQIIGVLREHEAGAKAAPPTRHKPGLIVSDHGTEFTSNAILAWSNDHRAEWRYIAPGKPMLNGYF